MVVVILEGQRGHAARDARIVVEERRRDRARIRGVEVGDVDVGRSVPVVRNLVAQFGESAVLFEAHVGAVAVRAVVRGRNDTRETSLADAVGGLGLQRVPRSVTDIQVGADPLFGLSPGDDVDHTAHGVRPVEHRCRAAHDLHAFGQHRLAGVGDRMAEDAHVLGLAVDQHEHLRRGAAAQTPQTHPAGSSGRDPVSHHAARRDEEPRHLLREQRQQRGFLTLFDLRTADDRDGHRQVADIGGVARPGHHDRVDRHVAGCSLRGRCLLRFGTGRDDACQQCADGQQDHCPISSHAPRFLSVPSCGG